MESLLKMIRRQDDYSTRGGNMLRTIKALSAAAMRIIVLGALLALSGGYVYAVGACVVNFLHK